jgi:cobalt-zinc-cadmium efflux system protein
MDHHHKHPESIGNIRIAFFLNLAFTLIEIAGGFLTNSLAILSDAVHDFGDSITLWLSWYLEKRSKGGESGRFSYGLGRLSLLAALLGGFVLLAGSLFILSEAVPRLIHPLHSDAGGMIVFALVGIAVNGAAALRVRRGKSMNEQVVSWHFIEDVLGWIAVLIAGVIIRFRDIHVLDPALSILIVLYVLGNAVRNLRKTLTMFLQGVPEDVEVERVEEALIGLPGVQEVHDTHVWTLDGVSHVLTTHLVTDEVIPKADEERIKTAARRLLLKYGIVHSTIEIEPYGQQCEPNELHKRLARTRL